MNKKVWTAMLVLTVVFLCMLYVAKIFFPQDFVMYIENERLIQIGNVIDSNKVLHYAVGSIFAFITYYLYCGACCRKIKLSLKDICYILITMVIVRAAEILDKDMMIFTHLNISAFLILPVLIGGDLKSTAFVYFIHGFSQIMSLSIRNLPMYLTTMNTITTLLLSIDMYFWLLLMFIIFNYKEKEE